MSCYPDDALEIRIQSGSKKVANTNTGITKGRKSRYDPGSRVIISSYSFKFLNLVGPPHAAKKAKELKLFLEIVKQKSKLLILRREPLSSSLRIGKI